MDFKIKISMIGKTQNVELPLYVLFQKYHNNYLEPS